MMGVSPPSHGIIQCWCQKKEKDASKPRPTDIRRAAFITHVNNTNKIAYLRSQNSRTRGGWKCRTGKRETELGHFWRRLKAAFECWPRRVPAKCGADVWTRVNKKLIRRWDSERELSLRRHCTRSKNTIDFLHTFRHRSFSATQVYQIQWNNAM